MSSVCPCVSVCVGGFGDEFLQRFVTELTMSDPGDLERTFAPVFIELQALTAEEARKNMLGGWCFLPHYITLLWFGIEDSRVVAH